MTYLKFLRICALLLAGVTLLSSCASNPVVQKTMQLSANKEVLIGEFGFWRRDCSDRHFEILIDEYPRGGELRFEVGDLVVPEDPIIGSAGKCVGEPITSKKVFYVANRGFTGTDFVSYTVKSSMFLQRKVYNVVINVE